jgi:hypothetical protein
MIKMKYLQSIFLLIVSKAATTQIKSDTLSLSKQQVVGTWQRNDSLVGSGLGQNFQFFMDNSFVFNVGSDADDARDIIQLRGKYRLQKNMIYFTILSRKVVDGGFEISDPGISMNIFNISGNKVKEIPEKNPKELADPCYITFIGRSHIKISREQYYKVN